MTKAQWDHLILSIETPNLMQMWEYGEALNAVGWTTERYLVYYDSHLIAFFQIVKKKYFYSTLVKLSRGPLFLDKSSLNAHLVPVLHELRRHWRFWKGQFFQMECELPLLPAYYNLLLGVLCRVSFRWDRYKKLKYFKFHLIFQ